MTALDPAARPAAADVATHAGCRTVAREPAASGAHRRARPRPPAIAGAATILAVAAVVTAAALPSAEHAVPSVAPHDPVGPETRTVAVVPPPAAPWEPASAVVSLHRMAATLGRAPRPRGCRRRRREVAADPRSGDIRRNVPTDQPPIGCVGDALAEGSTAAGGRLRTHSQADVPTRATPAARAWLAG